MAKGPGGSAPKGGMQPQQKKAEKPASKIGSIAKPSKAKEPWSSASRKS